MAYEIPKTASKQAIKQELKGAVRQTLKGDIGETLAQFNMKQLRKKLPSESKKAITEARKAVDPKKARYTTKERTHKATKAYVKHQRKPSGPGQETIGKGGPPSQKVQDAFKKIREMHKKGSEKVALSFSSLSKPSGFTGAMAGLGIGGGLGALSGSLMSEPGEKRKSKGALIGGGVGGAIGAGALGLSGQAGGAAMNISEDIGRLSEFDFKLFDLVDDLGSPAWNALTEAERKAAMDQIKAVNQARLSAARNVFGRTLTRGDLSRKLMLPAALGVAAAGGLIGMAAAKRSDSFRENRLNQRTAKKEDRQARQSVPGRRYDVPDVIPLKAPTMEGLDKAAEYHLKTHYQKALKKNKVPKELRKNSSASDLEVDSKQKNDKGVTGGKYKLPLNMDNGVPLENVTGTSEVEA